MAQSRLSASTAALSVETASALAESLTDIRYLITVRLGGEDFAGAAGFGLD
jgi:hypothetical protein